jgi:hypothetical protein
MNRDSCRCLRACRRDSPARRRWSGGHNPSSGGYRR